MFLKPFTAKTSQASKGAVRKQLQKTFQEKFNCEDKIYEIIPKKETLSQSRIQTHHGQKVIIYSVTKTPIAFEYEGRIYPTIFSTWIKPSLLKTLVINPPAMKFLSSGADLMLPGIVMKDSELPLLNNNEIVGVRVPGNLACVAIGLTLMSKDEMINNNMRGKGVKILHTFGDHLWGLTEKALPQMDVETTDKNEDVAATDSDSEIAVTSIEIKSGEVKMMSESEDEIDPLDQQQQQMDSLLYTCALHALKKEVKNSDLPLLTSTFFRVHMASRCPPNKQLNIKQSKYKKLSSFLQFLVDEGVIKLEDLAKGCTSITSVDKKHSLIKEFKILSVSSDEDEEDAPSISSSFGFISQEKYHPPEFVSMYGISHPVQPIFEAMGYKKSEVLSNVQVREIVRKYVCDNRLNAGSMVTLDPILHHIVHKNANGEEKVKWEQLFSTIFNKMKEHYKMILPGIVPVVYPGKPPTIRLAVEKRRGKAVTLIENLEPFMIKTDEFVAILRKKAQASTSVKNIQPPGVSQKQVYKQILVQGNQTKNIESIICGEHYQLNKKCIVAVSHALKPI